MFTGLTVTMSAVISPSKASTAVAPASTYVSFNATDTGETPNRVITGMVVSTTFTVRVTSTAAFPDESDTL